MNNVLKFPANVSRKAHARKSRVSKNGSPEEAPAILDNRSARSLSITAENGRLRDERHEVWRMAEAATRYWRARLKFEDALSRAQRMEMLEGSYHPAVDPDYRIPMVGRYRAALVKQLLTPAWDTASVKWKQTALATGEHCHTDVKPERIEQAIADDLAFLAAHPTRRGADSETVARRRAFKEAMRQRIREIAASRDLSDEEIGPVLSLKHQRVAKFVDKHGVNFKWLYEGMGSIFKTGPKLVEVGNPATVVATMPEADQQAIRATVREILQERDQ